MRTKNFFLLLTIFLLLAACRDVQDIATPQATAVPPTAAATATEATIDTPAATEVAAEPTATTMAEAAATEAPTATAVPAEPEPYTSDSGAYTLAYPGNATFYENQRPSVDGVIADAPDSISILDETDPGYIFTLSHFTLPAGSSVANFVDNYSECAGVTSDSGQEDTLGGEPALFFINVACGPFGSSYIYTVQGDMGYRFTIESNASYEDVVDRVQPILDSFMSEATVSGLNQLYYNETADFSLWLPSEWVVGEATDSPLGQTVLVGPEAAVTDGSSENMIIVADATDMTAEELAAALLCGSVDNCDAPELQDVTLRNNIPAYMTLIGEAGQPQLPWYIVEHDADQLIAFTMHDADTLASLEAITQSLTWGHILDTGTEGFAAARAARFTLADELQVNAYQVFISAVQFTEWPDGCLGIYQIDVFCTQMVTPGYIVTAELDGDLYQFHTNESGSVLVRVPGIIAPSGGIALTQEIGDTCTAVVYVPEDSVQAGICEQELTGYDNSAPAMATELDTIIRQYAPFHAQTPGGTINFNGLGDSTASPTEQRQIAELTRFVTDVIISGRVGAANQLAFSWNRTGGFAGFCDDLAVYTYGLALYSSCNPQPSDDTQMWLSADQMAQLYDWLDTYSSFEFAQSDPADVSDGMSVTLNFVGIGQEAAAEDEQQAIAEFAAELAAQANGQVTAVPEATPTPLPPVIVHTVTGDAGEVVGAFLAALLADQTGDSSLIYFTEELRQQITAAQTVPQLLGLEESLALYDYDIVDNGAGDGTAVVVATLNDETPPQTVTFTLIRQNDLWYINQVEP